MAGGQTTLVMVHEIYAGFNAWPHPAGMAGFL
jgi:hypothetical protein